MNPAVQQDKIDAISGRLPAYIALQEDLANLQQRVSLAVEGKARQALLPSLERAGYRLLRFGNMLRILYSYALRMEMRDEHLQGLTAILQAGALNEIEERLREQPLTAEGWAMIGLMVAMGQDKDRFDSVRVCWSEALQLRNGIDLYCDYAWLMSEHGAEEDAITLFDEAARLTGPDGFEAVLTIDPLRVVVDAEILTGLGAAFGRLEYYTAARWSFGYAIRLFESFALIDPPRYLPQLAATLHKQGNMLREKKEYAEGEVVYNRSIDLLRKLAQTKPHAYEPLLGKVIRSLARLQYRNENKDQFCNTLYYGVTIYERLADVSSSYESELSAIYRNLGSALYEIKDEGGARLLWEKAVPLQERLAESDPVRHERDLLASLQGLGISYEHKGEWAKSEAMYKRALEIKEKYRASNPDRYVAEKGKILRLLGRLYIRSMDLRLAEEVLREALDLYGEYTGQEVENLDDKRREILESLADIYHPTDGEEPGIEIMKRSLEVYQQLATIDPDKYNRKYLKAIVSLASEYADNSENEAARLLRLKAEGILSILSAVVQMRETKAHVHDGDASGGRSNIIDWNTAVAGSGDEDEDVDWRAERAENLFWLAILFDQEKDDMDARKTYGECVELYETLAQEDGKTFNPRLANALMYHGRYLQRRGETGDGQRLIDRALQYT